MSPNDLVHHAVDYTEDVSQQTPAITFHDLKKRKIEYVRILWVDTVNHVKSRTVPLGYFEKLLHTSRPGTSVAKVALGIVFLNTALGFGYVRFLLGEDRI